MMNQVTKDVISIMEKVPPFTKDQLASLAEEMPEEERKEFYDYPELTEHFVCRALKVNKNENRHTKGYDGTKKLRAGTYKPYPIYLVPEIKSQFKFTTLNAAKVPKTKNKEQSSHIISLLSDCTIGKHFWVVVPTSSLFEAIQKNLVSVDEQGSVHFYVNVDVANKRIIGFKGIHKNSKTYKNTQWLLDNGCIIGGKDSE